MSKAFTKEDDDAGFSMPASSNELGLPPGPVVVTSVGARLASAHPDLRVRDALIHADVLDPVVAPACAVLGVTVRVRGEDGRELEYRLVPATERALLDDGCSVDGPIGRALLGARVGDVREVAFPRGTEEVEVLALSGESPATH